MEPDIGGHMPPGSRLELKPIHDRAIEMRDRWTAFEAKLASRIKQQAEDQHFNWREQ
jgi:hypothetical protein